MTYASLSDVKLYLGIATATTGDDTLLTALISRAQSIIDSYCNRIFAADADTTRYFDAWEDIDKETYRTLYLDRDLASVTSITNGDGILVTSGEYVFEPRNSTPYYGITLKASSSTAWTYDTDPENAIAITGRWAYGTAAPDAIVQAHIRLTAWLYRQKDTSKDNSADRPIMAASGTVIMPSSLPRDIRDMLEPFRRTALG